MEVLNEIWPFAIGQQKLIFNFAGAAVIGLIILNVVSVIRQKLPPLKMLSGLFVHIGTQNKIEKLIRVVLFTFLIIGFIALVIDMQINGVQLVDGRN